MRACLLVGLLLASFGASENAQALEFTFGPNLLNNPSFENGLQSWDVNDETQVDWIVDYDFRPPNDDGLGAAVLLVQGQISQCVSVVPGTYTMSVWALGGCADTSTFVRIDWYSDSSCSILSGSDFETVLSNSSAWQLTSGPVQSTSSAGSARIIVARTGSCKEAIILDNADFTDQIFGSTFDE